MDKSSRNLKNVQALYTLEELNKLKEKIAKPKKSLQSNTSNVLLKNGSKKASTNLSATPGIKSYFSSTDTQRQSSKKNANTTPAATKVQKKPRPLAEETPRIVAQPTPTNAASSQRDPPDSSSAAPASLSNPSPKTPARRVVLMTGTGSTPEIKEKISKEKANKSVKDGRSTQDLLAETPNRPVSPSKVHPRKLNLSASQRTDTRSQKKKATNLDVTLQSPTGKTVVKVIDDANMISNLNPLLYTQQVRNYKDPLKNIPLDNDNTKTAETFRDMTSVGESEASSSMGANDNGGSTEANGVRKKVEEIERKLRSEVGKALEVRNVEIANLKMELKKLEGHSVAEVERLNVALEKTKAAKEELEATMNSERSTFGKIKESIIPLKLQLEKIIKDSADHEKTNAELRERNKVLTTELEETMESRASDKRNFEEEIEKLKIKLEEISKSKLDTEKASKVMLTEQDMLVKKQQEELSKKDKEIEKLKTSETSLRDFLLKKEEQLNEVIKSREEDQEMAKVDMKEMTNKINEANEKMSVASNVNKKLLKKKDEEIDHLKKKVKTLILNSIPSSSTSCKRKRSESTDRKSTSTPLKKNRSDVDKRRPSDDVDPVSDSEESHSLIIDESAEVPGNISDISGGSFSENCVSIDDSEHSALKEIFASENVGEKTKSSAVLPPVSTTKRPMTVEERMSQLFGEDTDESDSNEPNKSPEPSGDVPGESLLSESIDKTDQQRGQFYSPAKTSRVDHNYSMTTEKTKPGPDQPSLKLKDIKSLVAVFTQNYTVPIITDITPQDISDEANDEYKERQEQALHELLKAINEVVKKCLKKFYTNGSGTIKNAVEFEEFAKTFSHQFRDDFQEIIFAHHDWNGPCVFTIEQEDKKKMVDRILLYFNVKEIVQKILAMYPVGDKRKQQMVNHFTEGHYEKLKNTLWSIEVLGNGTPLTLTDDFTLQIKHNILRELYQ